VKPWMGAAAVAAVMAVLPSAALADNGDSVVQFKLPSKATMEHLDELVQSINGQLDITVAHNGFYPCSDEQQATLIDYIHENDLSLINFDLVKDKGEIAMRTVENVLKNGRGVTGLSPFTSIYFKKPIEELNL